MDLAILAAGVVTQVHRAPICATPAPASIGEVGTRSSCHVVVCGLSPCYANAGGEKSQEVTELRKLG